MQRLKLSTSPHKETTLLVRSLPIALRLIGIAEWWIANRTGIDASPSAKKPSPTILQFNAETFTQIQNVPNELFNYSGSPIGGIIHRELDTAIQPVWPKYRLRYTHPAKRQNLRQPTLNGASQERI